MFENLGAAIGDELTLSTCKARFHERGLALLDGGNDVAVSFAFPMIGRPRIATGNDPAFAPEAMTFAPGTWAIDRVRSATAEAVKDRMQLRATGVASLLFPLEVGPAQPLAGNRYGLALRSQLEDRRLHDVVLRVGAVEHTFAPHALYSRRSWNDFGLAHITDMHVARRIDSFRELLRQAGRGEAADRMYNWNDRFRGFIRFANALHKEGRLDLIVATGDLYDYIYEDDDDTSGGGNAEWLRRLILGEAPGPDFPDVEELRVPIFLTPGNHDYRLHPYKLVFDVKLRGINLGVVSWNPDVHRISNYSGYHLLAEDAFELANRLEGRSGTDVASETTDAAARMVEYVESNTVYRDMPAPLGPYVVELGPHRVAMFDSAHDVGVVADVIGVVKVKLGFGSEHENTFVGGSPNCKGVTPEAFNLITATLDATPDEGLFIVGSHAPLFNMWNNEYPYFLRQTQRPADRDFAQAYGFLGRNGEFVRLPHMPLEEGILATKKALESKYSQWFPAERDHREPAFVSRVDSQHLLEFGVSDHADELTARLAGRGARRAADLVLAGHTHRHNEFVVRPTHTGELAFYMDFYTENPTSYYPTRFATGWRAVTLPGEPPTSSTVVVPTTDVAYVDVVAGADAGGAPKPLDGSLMYKNVVSVPPYAQPLSEAADPRKWWAEHRPLVLQTGALGPLDTAQVSFSGFRMVVVRDNTIQRIHFISSERLERADFRLGWEEAIAPAPPIPRVLRADGAGKLYFYRDTTRDGTGDIANPSVIGNGGWQALRHLSAGSGGTIYAVDVDGQLLRYRDQTQDGTGDVANPAVIGLGGWQNMRQVFAGGDGVIYAVDQAGQLLFYRDDGAGDVASPIVISQGGWHHFSRVFSGGGGIIYAVDDAGRLVFYRDETRAGGRLASASIIGQGGWNQFLQLFSGGAGTIYAVNEQGQLLFYRDHTQNGTGDVHSPSVIGQGGWQHFRTLFAGDNGIIYAVGDVHAPVVPPAVRLGGVARRFGG